MNGRRSVVCTYRLFILPSLRLLRITTDALEDPPIVMGGGIGISKVQCN